MKKIISSISPILLLFAGLFVVASGSIFSSRRVSCLVTVSLFILFDWLTARWLNLTPRLKLTWDVRKIWHILLGFIIGLAPMTCAYLELFYQNKLPTFKGVSFWAAFFVFLSVSWEELWFRGTAIELGASKYTKIGVTITFAFVFMLMHLGNPEVQILLDGGQLWLAGCLLAMTYFTFESIWAPIGLHFANNIAQTVFGLQMEPRSFGYVVPLVLVTAGMTFVFLKKRAKPSRLR